MCISLSVVDHLLMRPSLKYTEKSIIQCPDMVRTALSALPHIKLSLLEDILVKYPHK